MKLSHKHLLLSIWSLLLCLFCANQSVAQPAVGQVIEKIVAKVDDEIILQSDLEAAYMQASNSPNFFSLENPKCQVLEGLIVNKLLVAKAVIDSVTVEDEMVSSQLDRRMAMLMQTYGMDCETLAQQYGKSCSDLKEELRDQVREQLIVQKMQEKITADVKITPGQVKRFYKSIPQDSLPFFSSEMEIGQIVIFPKPGQSEKGKSMELLKDLKYRIENGENFGELAKQYSKDPGSGSQGGELGWFKTGELVPEYEAMALSLKPGELGIAESQFGLHLIELLERRGNEYRSRHILLTIASSELDVKATKNTLDSLRNEIVNGNVTFSKVVSEYSEDPMTKSTGGMFLSQETGSSRIAADKLDYSLYFLVDEMQPGDISTPQTYTTPDGKQALRIVYLKDKIAPHVANLQDDYQKFQAAALAEKKNTAINKWFEEVKDQVFVKVDPEFDYCEVLK